MTPPAGPPETRLPIERVRAGLAWQRDLCRRGGDATAVAILEALTDALDADGLVAELLTAEGQDPVRSAQGLRLLGAVQRVATASPDSFVFARYPTLGGGVDTERVGPEFIAFLTANTAAVRAELPAAVQTNEVGRAAPLSAAFAHVTRETGLPLRLLEVGASAGLNLFADRYRVTGAVASWGPADSPVRLIDPFEHGAPPALDLRIVERRGCDLHPLDVHEPASVRLLRSFVWPEHVERARRLEAAIEVARAEPRVTIDAADAVAWIDEHVPCADAGRTTVLVHSVVMPYLAPDERARFERTVRRHGDAATDDRPVAWVSFEPSDGEAGVVDLTCELWPAGRRVRLATCTPHGTRVRWEPQEL